MSFSSQDILRHDMVYFMGFYWCNIDPIPTNNCSQITSKIQLLYSNNIYHLYCEDILNAYISKYLKVNIHSLPNQKLPCWLGTDQHCLFKYFR